MQHVALPERYNQMVMYSESLIDTQTQIFLTDQFDAPWDMNHPELQAYQEFKSYIYLFLPPESGNEPKAQNYTIKNFTKHYHAQLRWDSIYFATAGELLQSDNKVAHLLEAAISEALKNPHGNNELEFLLEKVGLTETALHLLRHRRVYPECSHDGSPRIHARSIARLSAVSGNWSIFLRSHLDILNDYFVREDENSTAQTNRSTYIRELEALNIHVQNLLMGICMSVDNPAENHYFGRGRDVYKALAESRDRVTFEADVLQAIFDNELDFYNRDKFFWLYLNYLQQLGVEGKDSLKQFKTRSSELPIWLRDYLAKFEIGN